MKDLHWSNTLYSNIYCVDIPALLNYDFCLVSCIFWRVAEVLVIFCCFRLKWPPNHVWGQRYPSRQQKHRGCGSFSMYSQGLNTVTCFPGSFLKVSILSMLFVCQLKQQSKPKHILRCYASLINYLGDGSFFIHF